MKKTYWVDKNHPEKGKVVVEFDDIGTALDAFLWVIILSAPIMCGLLALITLLSMWMEKW